MSKQGVDICNDKTRPEIRNAMPKPVDGLSSFDLDGIANYIKAKNPTSVVMLEGAGISTAAGIPDFRTPGTGLYSTLQKYNLPQPEAVFEIEYFHSNPKPFYSLMSEMIDDKYMPTMAHYLAVLLAKKGMLKRLYTQNIDGLDRKAGLDDDLLVEAHGTFFTAHCLKCNHAYTFDEYRDDIKTGDVLHCKHCADEGIVKPDVVFYGEGLPARFFDLLDNDFNNCDLLIVIGTSLVVEPFASVIEYPPRNVPRLLINNQPAKTFKEIPIFKDGRIVDVSPYRNTQLFRFGHILNTRDVHADGDLQDQVLALVEKCGWSQEFHDLLPPGTPGLKPVESSPEVSDVQSE